ncbi:ATP-binding cassette domain-containing protein [Butyricimonas paravirosa]|uniref:ATP-binding cassette domain-containing protein n=1 Tax=Butyricimonas paravirosa TaxID=1472417 RepID=UPI00210BF34E|nr:ATP-binding cassette domain-containing protein [Butyricimonas paravirosa]MCQ4873700.1 ATP-binding cassette domain-containing protein [Butyricimonas paravirosa]
MMHTLDISNLRLEYGFNRVLWDTCLHCETGKVVGILGRNGGGKSCLMRVIYGELMLKDQYVAIDRKALLTRERRPEDMRYLLQQSFVPLGLSVRRVFDDFGVDFNEFVTDFPEFGNDARKRMKAFSTGERRIIEVYVVLVADSKFCLLDEPFSFMMPLHVQKMKEVIRREKARKGIVITDHYFEDVIDISDELFVLKGGKTWPVSDRGDLELLEYIKKTDEIQY